jgi:hypothetical protein
MGRADEHTSSSRCTCDFHPDLLLGVTFYLGHKWGQWFGDQNRNVTLAMPEVLVALNLHRFRAGLLDSYDVQLPAGEVFLKFSDVVLQATLQV